MAWRPSQYVINGEFDNTTPGKVVGWIKFAGLKKKIIFDLEGNFHRDIRGTIVKFIGDAMHMVDEDEAKKYMKHIALHHTGKVGDMTAGHEPVEYTRYPYFEVYSDQNGRIVIEFDPEQVTVVGTPIPAEESDPVSREEQNKNMLNFLNGLMGGTEEQ